MLKYALLGFLSYTSLTGYELENWINVSTGNFWHAKLSQIYATLKSLEENGLVTSHVEPQEGRPDRRVYTITDAGRADLHEWLATPILDSEVKKDGLLLKLFFSYPTGKDAILTQLRLHLDLHRRQLARYRHDAIDALQDAVERVPAIQKDTFMWDMVRRYGEMYEAMYIDWLQQTIEEVQKHFPD